MIYMSPQSRITRPLSSRWGYILTPKSRASVRDDNRYWCADNGIYTARFQWDGYYSWLIKMMPYRARCLFVTAPDVVGNAVATLDRYRYYAWRIKELGFPVALVAQDGLENLPWPPEYDVLFIGGSTSWKLGPEAAWCITHAKKHSKWVHIGRVNSRKRILHFRHLDADSADGTAVCFEPDAAYTWINSALTEPLQTYPDRRDGLRPAPVRDASATDFPETCW